MRNIRRIIRIVDGFALFTLGGILFVCAKQGMPPGGPEDKIPPEVVSTKPANGSIGVAPASRVEITFSEPVRPASAMDAVFITPFPGDDIDLKWRRRKLIIQFPKPFKPDRTIVVTLGTAIQDEQGNPMKSSYTLAFSTGDHIDDRVITGRVFGAGNLKGVGLWAYSLNVNPNPDPSVLQPDYVSQCDEQGYFRMSYLPSLPFRVFAVRDKALDRLFQTDEDEIGVPSREVSFKPDSHERTDSLFFRLSRIDTTGPSLTGVSSISRNRIVLRFDKPVVLDSCRALIAAKHDSLDTLTVTDLYPDPISPNTGYGITRDQKNETYRICLSGLRDLNGNRAVLDTTGFQGKALPDTSMPKVISITPSPNERQTSVDIPIRWVFNMPMDTMLLKKGFGLSDSLQIVSGSMKWITPVEMVYFPLKNLEGQTDFTMKLSGTMNRWGVSLPDTVIHFRTMNPDTLSEISGKIDSGSKKGLIILKARQTQKPEIAYTITIDNESRYLLRGVLPGLYWVDFFLDSDGDGKWNAGFPFPFRASESFYQPPDTIHVRSRWPNEGNDFQLP